MNFNINEFMNVSKKNNRYDKRIQSLREVYDTRHIEQTVNDSIKNVKAGCKSFVIYGEPQSGKTEMMIALTAKLLDEGHKVIVLLLNDNVQLLEQNLERFIDSNIDPTPKNFLNVLDEEIGNREWVIFCKKNIGDLKKLIDHLDGIKNKVIIDDEADFATPNAKINQDERTAINNAIYKLLDNTGYYIGVTATPARLDLNNTFDNISEKWVYFPPHKDYVGKEEFFPLGLGQGKKKFKLFPLPDTGDHPSHLRDALFRFFISVSILNCTKEKKENYSFLIHTSGKKVDHSVDHKVVLKVFEVLSDSAHKDYKKYVECLYNHASNKVDNPKQIVTYVLQNINNKTVEVLNSNRKTDTKVTNSPSIFTVVIGGNIVSRGVTFSNLLSMFFTRDVKHQLQQDTYIQRARMFGNRGKYIEHFELSIPSNLYMDWHKCFVFHYLSLEAIKSGSNAPVWISDGRVKPVAASSIDKSRVSLDTGEMAFKLFEFDERIRQLVKSKNDPISILNEINKIMNDEVIPEYVIRFIKEYAFGGSKCVCIHDVRDVSPTAKYHDELYMKNKGIIGGDMLKSHPEVVHHIMVVKNTFNKARVVYRHRGNIKFFKNLVKENEIDK